MGNTLRPILRSGLLAALAVWYVALVGMLQTFAGRNIISDVLSLGYILVAVLMLFVAYGAASKTASKVAALSSGALIGLIAGLLTAILAVIANTFTGLRGIFEFVSPRLVAILTFGQGAPAGLVLTILALTAVGLLGGLLAILPDRPRRILIIAASIMLAVGLMRDVLAPLLPDFLVDLLFTSSGLTWAGTILVFGLTALIVAGNQMRRQRASAASLTAGAAQQRSKTQRTLLIALGILFLASFPLWSKVFLSNVADFVGLYIIMGLGLNLVVGFAGMLDLGYVGFYAIGAYTTAILTSPDLGRFSLTYWEALPVAMIMAMVAGVLLGLPVLRMRGDYLAITTLGFGEIIRIILLSDWLKPFTGGAQGITQIGRPKLGAFVFDTPQDIYYLILIGSLIAWFVGWRLKNSRLGRSWMAIREDEDVAQAMGINRTMGKLMAFATGAFLGGMAGSIFASMVGSVVPKSFELLVSINVLALIIVGGMGSLPGVLVGAFVLVGLPELLREFREYRLLVYGLVLMFMMLYRPEGLWPEATRRRELHEEAEPIAEETDQAASLQAAGG